MAPSLSAHSNGPCGTGSKYDVYEALLSLRLVTVCGGEINRCYMYV